MRRGIPTKLVVGATLSILRTVKRPVWSAVYSLTGKRLQLPLGIFDLSMFGGSFEANAQAAQARMPSRDLHVIEHAAGKTEVVVLAFDHRAPDRSCIVARRKSERVRQSRDQRLDIFERRALRQRRIENVFETAF